VQSTRNLIYNVALAVGDAIILFCPPFFVNLHVSFALIHSQKVIPITDAMHEPHKLPNVLTGVMLGILGASSFHSRLLFLTRGSAPRRRVTFGSEIHTVVLVNFDAESKMVQLVSLFSSPLSVKPLTYGMQVQFIYSLVIMLSVPLQLLPATIPWRTQSDVWVKWTKNVFRCGALISCLALCMVLKCTSDSGSGRSGVRRRSAGWGRGSGRARCIHWVLCVVHASRSSLPQPPPHSHVAP
jgi:hypothetical protein